MNRYLLLPLIVSFACTTADDISPQSVVLNSDSAAVFKTNCWGDLLSAFQGTWVPDEETVRDLDSHLELLDKMLHKRGCRAPKSNPVAARYRFQYVGVQVNGRRMVFVNGFALTIDDASNFNEPNTICALVNDGGCSFFGALYDPVSKTFTHLEIAPIA